MWLVSYNSLLAEERIDSYASNALPIGTALLTLLYLVHTLLYLSGTTNPDGSEAPAGLALVTGVSTFIFAGASLYAFRDHRNRAMDSHLIGVCALLVLANVTIHFGASKDIWHGYNFIFYQIAVGALITSTPWLLVLLALTAVSGAGAAYVGLGSVPWGLFVAMATIGSLLSILLHATRRYAVGRLQKMTIQAERSQREAEAALRASEETARSLERAQHDMQGILDKSPEAILIQRDGKIAYMNPAFLDCLRIDEDDAIGQPVQTLSLDGKSLPMTRTQAMLKRTDGQAVLMQLSEPALVQYQGHSSSLVMGRDITEKDSELQAKLVLADRMAAVGVLASGVAHEINNPMAYVLGNLEVLDADLNALTPGMKDEHRTELRELIADCLHGGRRVGEIVKELRIIAHPEDSELAGDLCQAIKSAERMASNHIRHKSSSMVVSIPDDVPTVAASTARLSQVFLNLLINAAQSLDARDSRNQITVTARVAKSATAIEVEVRDTGSGMTPESQRRLFEPFFTTKDVGEGSGLGLYFCRNEMARIGGTIGFESEVGVGSSFRVTIPIAEGTDREKVSVSSHVTPSKLGVLIIDDEPLVARSLGRLLVGHDVSIARTAAEAFELLDKKDFDIIFCDLMMPEVSGAELYEQVTTKRSELSERFVFITGGSFSPGNDAMLEKRTNQVLYKPFTKVALEAVLANATRRREETPSTAMTSGP